MSKTTITKLVVVAFLTLAAVGCGGVDIHTGGSGEAGANTGRATGYYYLEDARYDYWWYYSDGLQWWHWDGDWVVDSAFAWYDNSGNWYRYEYDPLWYDPYYNPSGVYYDDPHYWDDVYLDDSGYYGDDWYYDGYWDDVYLDDSGYYGDDWYYDGYYGWDY